MPIPTVLGSRPAIEKISVKGYASYSSLKNVRDGWDGKSYSYPALDIGTEVHSRWLEQTRLKKFNGVDEKMMRAMITNLNNDKLATQIKVGSQFEVEFRVPIMGLDILGYIDILPPKKIIGDLKTTKCTKLKDFIEQQDFLQPALYLTALERDDFYYVGISKVEPYEVFTFRTSQYPKRLQASLTQMKELIKYVKAKLKERKEAASKK